MATYTLTFASDVDVTVDGKTVTSPYTLTKSCTINVSTMVNPNSNYYISINGTEVLSETVNFADEDLHIYANTSSTGRTLALNAVVNFTISAPPKVTVDLTSLSGYESLAAGTYQLSVKAKAAGYQDSDLSSTVSFTKLAAPVVTAADTTVTWDAITNAESYDVYVDGELYENTTGGVTYNITTTVTNGTYSGDTTITDMATVTITANTGYALPDSVTVTGASQTWNKETGTLTLSNPTGDVTVEAVCVAVVIYHTISFTWSNTVYVNGTQVSTGVGGSYDKIKAGDTIRVTTSRGYIATSGFPNEPAPLVNGTYIFPAQDIEIYGINNDLHSTATDVTFILT